MIPRRPLFLRERNLQSPTWLLKQHVDVYWFEPQDVTVAINASETTIKATLDRRHLPIQLTCDDPCSPPTEQDILFHVDSKEIC